MDTGSLKVLELALIVGVVGYFYFRQRNNLQRLKDEREAGQQADEKTPETDRGDGDSRS
ncbi:hypothetical protein [Halochromatium glycolicum]|jgi:uncharacterized protein HemX|uniref:hypothetical protein n=1 Tax=Halochromatium glycolicum TaxID=85075 RepID=UPI00190942EA|nr:hypothetical protein [Halochromatium glycolicum]